MLIDKNGSGLLRHPQLKKQFTFDKIDDSKAMLHGFENNVLLKGRQHILILEKIKDGKLTTDDLIYELMDEVMPHQVLQIVEDLENKGYVTEAYDTLDLEQAVYWENCEVNPSVMNMKIMEGSISVQKLGRVGAERLEAICGELKIKIAPKETSSLHLVITEDYLDPQLKLINEKALHENKPWMLVRPTGTETLIGPIFNGNQTACWNCLKHRLELNQPHRRYYQAVTGKHEHPVSNLCAHPIAVDMTINMAALEIIKWMNKPNESQLIGNLLSFNSKNLKSELHELVKRPQCATCSNVKNTLSRPIQIERNQKLFLGTAQNGYRMVSAKETYQKYKHHVSRYTGIIQKITPYKETNNDWIYNYSSGRNMALDGFTMTSQHLNLRSFNGGKGKSNEQAKTSALCEGIERYCMIYNGQNFGIKNSYHELEGAMHPNLMMNFSTSSI